MSKTWEIPSFLQNATTRSPCSESIKTTDSETFSLQDVVSAYDNLLKLITSMEINSSSSSSFDWMGVYRSLQLVCRVLLRIHVDMHHRTLFSKQQEQSIQTTLERAKEHHRYLLLGMLLHRQPPDGSDTLPNVPDLEDSIRVVLVVVSPSSTTTVVVTGDDDDDTTVRLPLYQWYSTIDHEILDTPNNKNNTNDDNSDDDDDEESSGTFVNLASLDRTYLAQEEADLIRMASTPIP